MQLKDVFVENLRKYRRERGMSQAMFAEKCDTATSYIGQIEIGNRFPSLELIEKMAKVLKIRPYLLFFIESDDDTDEKILEKEKDTISDTKKEELTNRLTDAIRRIVKNID
jgi:transcriptional regulator with XRE-family HTH domain